MYGYPRNGPGMMRRDHRKEAPVMHFKYIVYFIG